MLEGSMLFLILIKGHLKIFSSGNLNVHRPGIEPGPPAWQARILPLNQQCLAYSAVLMWGTRSTKLILQVIKTLMHCRGIEPRSPAWQARILPLNQQCSRAANVPTQKLALSQKRVKDTQNWPRWGSNPQSSDSKSDALSIGPRGRCLCRNLAWHHRKSYSDAWPTMASSCDLKCFTYNLFPSLNYLI